MREHALDVFEPNLGAAAVLGPHRLPAELYHL